MQQITHNNREILCVEVPEGMKNFKIIKYPFAGTWVMETDSKELNHWKKNISANNPHILGLASELTEEQAEDLVEDHYFNNYENYEDEHGELFTTAIKSLHSLITSKGLKPETTLLIEKNKTL